MLFEAVHTHLYPGLRGRLTGTPGGVVPETGGDCLIAFSDGASTPGRLSHVVDGWRLYAEAYRTTAGTAIPAKAWRLALSDGAGTVKVRVVEKLGG